MNKKWFYGLSERIDMNSIVISLRFEILLRQLLGQRLLPIHGLNQEHSWKKILKRIARVIEKSIKKNVKTDGLHETQLNIYINGLKDVVKKETLIDIEVIHFLVGIIFELLGGLPNYYGRKVMNRRDDYILDDLRTLQYYQSPTQKVKTILEASKGTPLYDDLWRMSAVLDYEYNPEGFINWYKDKYPDLYLKLF